MFEYPGLRIKGIARILFWIIISFSLGLALSLGFSEDWGGHLEFHALPFLGFLFGGSIVATTTGLFLFGYGELIESTQNTAESMKELTGLIQKLVKKTAEREQKETTHNPATTKTDKPCTFTNPAPASDNSGWILCKKCGQSQRSNRVICFNCGERL